MSRLHSIRTRLLVWTIGVSGLILAAVISWGYVKVRARLERETITKASYLTEVSADRIDTILSRLQGITQGIALALEAQRLDIPPRDLRALMTSALRDNPDIYGICVAVMPFALPPGWTDPAPWIYRERDSFVYDGQPEDRSYIGEDWFVLPRYLNRASWTEPYLEATGVKMVSYAVPVHRNIGGEEQFVGVVVCDIDLGWLERTIADLSFGKSGYAFLMSRNGVYITHPQQELVFNESVFSVAEERGDASLRRVGQGMISGVPGLINFVSFVTGQDSWLSWQPLKSADWIIGSITSKAELRAGVLELSRDEALVGVAGLSLLVLAVWLIARSITKPVQKLGEAAGQLAAGNLDAILPVPKGRDEVASLTAAFVAMRDSLKRYIADLAETMAARERMNSELRVAHDIQMDLVPKTFPAFPSRPDLDLFAIIEPAKQVGGDFYDFFMIDPTHIVLAIGDVSGKGVPAALFMAVTRSFLRSEFRVESNPGRTLSRVNDELSEGNDSCMFVTLFCAVVCIEDGSVEYANAGHNPPLRIRTDGSLEWVVEPHGPVAGAMPGESFDTGHFVLRHDESLLLYTDGVTEAMDPARILYGESRLASCVTASAGFGCRQLLGRLMEDIRAHASGAEQSDDITMLMFRFLGRNPEGGAP